MEKLNFSNKNSETVRKVPAEEDEGSTSDFGLNVVFTKVQLNHQTQVCDRNGFQVVPQLALVYYA